MTAPQKPPEAVGRSLAKIWADVETSMYQLGLAIRDAQEALEALQPTEQDERISR